MSTTLIPLATRVEPKLRAEVHEFRKQQDPIPSAAEALRELLKLGLRAAAQQARREKKQTT
jgi:hypothetical protein